MKYALWTVGVLLGSSVIARAQTDPAPDNHQAQAGVRIGRVFIGDSLSAVERRLGKPTRIFTLGGGLTSQLWRSGKVGDTGNPNTLEVVYRNGVVCQIEATSLVFKTPAKLSLASPRAQWEKMYGKPTATVYDYGVNGRKRYLDWASRGIAVEQIEDENEVRTHDSWIYQTLIVHKKGSPVLPDKGGVRR